MRGRTLTDTQLLLELVGEAYSFEDLTQFRSGVLEVLNRMVPSDRVAYNEIAPDETFAVMIPEFDASLIPIFTALAHENPLISRFQRTGDGRPYRISDMIDQQTFHATALYREFYRHMGIESQVAFSLPSPPDLLVGLALTREHEDFSDREVQLLALARPHLMQAYRNAELSSARTGMLAALEQGLDTLGRHVVVLDPHERVEFATDGARRLLGDRFAQRGWLASEVRAWISEHRGPRPAASPLVLRSGEESVLVRLLPSPREDRREVLLLEGGSGELSVAALRGLGLTARQADTLRRVALNQSPAQAAVEMGIAPRTVDKHLQNIYAKLGVSSLTQASAIAWAAVGIER
ncbi:MAG TPA: LuxR C-terminal-related transcriptional regulator [Solirubrobacteraceae bacterium]|nr:LuxR C-terminal-related transcriptional regulator [Solirubrobacteraceae bacterium]